MTIALVMGVSGCGKSTIARAIADRMGWHFQEGDKLHPPGNVAKMASGVPLTDVDRAPWLGTIADVMRGWQEAGTSGVVACSALKRAYRETLLAGLVDARLIFLLGERATIAARLATRDDHFMPPSLLDSQFATLEPPNETERPVIVAINRPVADIVDELIVRLS